MYHTKYKKIAIKVLKLSNVKIQLYLNSIDQNNSSLTFGMNRFSEDLVQGALSR